MAKSGRLELGNNIYGHYKSIVNHCDVIGRQRNRKTQNDGYYAIQGHRRWYQSKAHMKLLLVINTCSNGYPIS